MAVPKGPLRTGYTTGACAAAAAKAAATALLTGLPVSASEILLPAGRRVSFAIERCRVGDGAATASTIKDGGDDPDCTHGAEVGATVRPGTPGEARILRGKGVGLITKAGLGIEVGGPAVNPVPRRMIRQAVEEAAPEMFRGRGFDVEIFVVDGEAIAKKTLNHRLGILGGISILGTTGIVVPYSTRAFEESIVQAMDVCAAAGIREVVLTTGGSSEKFARAILPGLPEEAFIQMGDFAGFALKGAGARPLSRVYLVGMPGKFSKLAEGITMTHAAGSQVNLEFLARLAAEEGASPDLAAAIRAANTARHVYEIVQAAGFARFFPRLCREICRVGAALTEGKVPVEAIITDFEGRALGRERSDGG